MRRDRQRQFINGDAAAVVGDADEFAPALLDGDVDSRRAGIDRILDDLLDHARRPLDDLARGDLVHKQRWQAVDGHGGVRR